MNMRGSDGAPLISHIKQDANGLMPNDKATAQLEAYLIQRPPLAALDVWETYVELDARRDWDENGPKRISWVDLSGYQDTNDIRLGRWQLKTIFALEDAWFSIRAENKGK